MWSLILSCNFSFSGDLLSDQLISLYNVCCSSTVGSYLGDGIGVKKIPNSSEEKDFSTLFRQLLLN